MARNRDLKLSAYVDKAGKHRWRCVAGNGRQLAKSPRSYEHRHDLWKDVREILSGPRDPQVYSGKDGWRWRYLNPEGRISAIGSEAYVNRSDCLESANLFLDATPA
jgi:uncharacterized protein YegP (UPF0339 family)